MKTRILLPFFLFLTFALAAQDAKPGIQRLFEPADSLNKARFWTLNGGLIGGYTGVVVALDRVWYAQFPRSRFHFFNDMGEWEDMDKFGHLYTAYFEAKFTSGLYQWAGVPDKKADIAGVVLGTVFQGTLETLDGFSEEWGWSWGDIGFNTGGVLLFWGQELAWQEQRILLKLSSWRRPPSDMMINSTDGLHTYSIIQRQNELYGTGIGEVLLKDYNALTIWASVNIHSFIRNEDTKFPKWLNVAVGYGAENIYGGFSNEWTDEETGAKYILNADDYPRYRQFFLSFDVDLTRIKTRNRFLKTLFSAINIIKIPAPALEFNTQGDVRFRAFYF